MSGESGGAGEWERHWRAYDDAAHRNPAQRYRRRLILDCIATSTAPLRILDVGCGQGDLLAEARRRFPRAELAGLDGSVAGLELARRRVPDAKLQRTDFEADPLPEALHGFATHAVCSEVLEHLDKPEVILENVRALLAPGGRLIVTVPGGPRSAFDVHIGHRRHYGPQQLAALLAHTGYEEETLRGAGFPMFNLYKLVVILRGKRLIRDVDQGQGTSLASALAMAAFDQLFRLDLGGTHLGWQTFGVFRAR